MTTTRQQVIESLKAFHGDTIRAFKDENIRKAVNKNLANFISKHIDYNKIKEQIENETN